MEPQSSEPAKVEKPVIGVKSSDERIPVGRSVGAFVEPGGKRSKMDSDRLFLIEDWIASVNLNLETWSLCERDEHSPLFEHSLEKGREPPIPRMSRTGTHVQTRP